MKQFSRLVYFEWKKIWKRKSTWITLGILIIFYLVMEGFYFYGSTYIEGEFLETNVEGTKIDVENGRRLSGRKIDDTLLQEMQEAYAQFAGETDKKYMLTEAYQKTARPYSILYNTLYYMLWESDINLLTVTEKQLYEARTASLSEKWDAYKLTDSEKEYWRKKEDQLTKPFTYQYAEGYAYLLSMSGVYRICLLVSFLIAICISAVFTEEHGRKTDQLILCSKLGRRQIYYAKVVAGSLYSLFATAILFLLAMICAFSMYGADGFSASIQTVAAFYSETFTVGQVVLIMTGILFLASILTSVFTMALSEITNSNIAAMSVVIAGIFLARLIEIPYQYRLLSQVWNFIPINLLLFDVFRDVRLVSLFGLKLTAWQFSTILYAVLIILFIAAGKRIYCRCQVKGR